MKTIAIITARGGSKRIPRKNIKLFSGKPIIAYSIEAAIQSGLFDTVMVSTDDKEIADISKTYGAQVPFFRSDKTSDDYASTVDVMVEVLEQFKDRGIEFEYACCIYPTAPFITARNLHRSFNLLKENNFSTVFPVCTFSYPIFRSLKMNDKGKVEMIWPENVKKRSQDLPSTYHDAGQFYWVNISSFVKEKQLFGSDSGGFILSELEVQDIDNEDDWKLAEIKYQMVKKK